MATAHAPDAPPANRYPAAPRPAAADAAAAHPVVVVGAGPVGLALAIDLAQRGVPVVLLDDDDTLATGSRAICFAKRSLEIFDRLGCGQRMVDKGVSWNVGKVFFRDAQVYAFDLLEEAGHARPAFINLQQYHVEGYLVERAAELPLIDLRWKHAVTGLEQSEDGVELTVQTPEGGYVLRARHVVACDGSRSALRRLAGQASEGRVFRDRFLIADVKMRLERPAERWFWFDPAFHPGQSVLLHMQPDGVWRIDFQLGWDADPEAEKRPERIIPRVRALLGEDAEFELVWASVYTFACTRMPRFRVGRVLFAGDAAHGVSPFGARGANSGIQDADNLGWKLAAVLAGRAGEALLDSYASEREYAADENIRQSTRSTDFITPKSEVSRLFRDAVLDLARDHGFARRLVNSGRLSVPAVLDGSPLSTPDADRGDQAFAAGAPRPGATAVDAPLRRPDGSDGWLLAELGAAAQSTLLLYEAPADGAAALADGAAAAGLPLRVLAVQGADAPALPGTAVDVQGLVATRYDLRPGNAYLLRPDQHVAARWRQPTPPALQAALRRLHAREPLPAESAANAPHAS